MYEKYPTHHELEECKQEGWKRISESNCPRQKAMQYMNRIIWSDYWKARQEIETQRDCKALLKKIRGKKYYSYYVLDIDHYTLHWLHANKVPEDVLDVIKEQWHYEPEENKYLPEGRTSYVFTE
jgi:hypothetical protein